MRDLTIDFKPEKFSKKANIIRKAALFSNRLLLTPPEMFCQNRSSHRGCSVRKAVLRNFEKFTGKHLCQSFFFNKVSLLKKRLWHKCFPVNFAKFLKTPFLQNTYG